MMIEYIVLMCVWIISISMLIFCVPKRKARIAYAGFLFKQTITWIAGLYVVEKGWIVYPVRLFPEQNRSSFTYVHWAWYWTWLTLLLTFYLSRIFCLWFFQAKRLPA